jgi:hypothetical protein
VHTVTVSTATATVMWTVALSGAKSLRGEHQIDAGHGDYRCCCDSAEIEPVD